MTTQHFREPMGASAPENYERYFVPAIGAPLAVDLLRAAALRPDERVLDAGCGTGTVARLAAKRVGSGGTVAGLDVNPGMLAVARAVTPPDLAVEWHQGDAEAMPFPDESFDVVLCQLSLQFLTDRVRGLREMRRVLVSGGRLVLNVPGPTTPVFDVLANAMGRHIRPEAAGFVRQVFSLHNQDELRDDLESAGFRDLAIRDYVKELPLPEPRAFLWQYVGATPLSAVVAGAGDQARAALEREVVAKWREYEKDGLLDYRQRVVLANARR